MSVHPTVGALADELMSCTYTIGVDVPVLFPTVLEDQRYLTGIVTADILHFGTGFGLYDVDMVLPVELRFGKYLTDRWYIMGELTYHVSLAGETACLEPAIRVGYNFGRKVKARN